MPSENSSRITGGVTRSQQKHKSSRMKTGYIPVNFYRS
jgi:hypothetical protein